MLIFKSKYQLLSKMTLSNELTLILNSLDSNVICIINDYLKPFPFKKEIESFQKPKVEYKVFQYYQTNFWGNNLYFYTNKGTINFTGNFSASTKRNVYNSSPNTTQYEYCANCSLKFKEELWHHYNIDCKK